MENPHLHGLVVRAISKEVQGELKEICSDNYDTILRMKYKVALENFTWSRVWKELQSKTPTLLEILSGGCSNGPVQPDVCTCASILMKRRNPKVNLVQAMVSVVLKAGHANTQVCVVRSTPQKVTHMNNAVIPLIQVFNRLQKIQLCLSHKSTLRFLDIASEEYDEKVHRWRESLLERTTNPGNSVCLITFFLLHNN